MFDKFLNFLFPQKCVYCGAPDTSICISCFNKIPKDFVKKNGVESMYSFRDEKVSELLWNLKYRHDGDVAKRFGKELAKHILSELDGGIKIFLLPIPLNKDDRRLNNHAGLIAKAMMENLQIYRAEIFTDIFIKNSKKQQNKTSGKKERLENIQNAFSIKRDAFAKLFNSFDENTTIVIVDDVSTSGATLGAAKQVLEEAWQAEQNRRGSAAPHQTPIHRILLLSAAH